MNQLSRWHDCKYCGKKCNGDFQYLEHRRNEHPKEYKIEHDCICIVFCYDCNTRCAIEKMHLHHKVGVITLGELDQMTLVTDGISKENQT